MFNKRYLLYFLLIFVFLITASTISAEDTININDYNACGHDAVVEKCIETRTDKTEVQSNNIKDTVINDTIQKNDKKETKNLPKKDLGISSEDNITANVGDVVSVPFAFNDTVTDGKLSISYGGSVDNSIVISESTRTISFDTTGYLHGEYELVIDYYDSSTYSDTSTSLGLFLYQPTSIRSQKSEVNIVLGNSNEYEVNFVTGRDVWDDVIWGSVDVYVDEKIIGSLIVNDESQNSASIVLDDYNLENISPGTHTLKAVFSADDPYIKSSSTIIILTVSGNVDIQLPANITVLTKNEFIIPANVTFNANNVSQGNISYYINDVLIETLPVGVLENGLSHVANYKPGTYTLRVDFSDDDGLYPDASNSCLLVVRSNTNIHTTTTQTSVLRTRFTFNINDDWSDPINTLANVTLSNGTKYENIEVNGGHIINFPYLMPGENHIIVETPESTHFESGYYEHHFNVSKEESQTNAIIQKNDVRYTIIEVKVTNYHSSNAVDGGRIEIVNTATNEIVGSGQLDSQGNANITTSIKQTGTYALRVDFKGNEIYNPSSKELTVTVNRINTYTFVSTYNQTIGYTGVRVMVKETDHHFTVRNSPITITLPDGSVVNANTGDGVATVPLDLPAGMNTIDAKYMGNESHYPSNKTVRILVLKRNSNTTAILTNSSVYNVTVNVNVKDNDTGEIVAGGNIEVYTKNGQLVGTGSIDENGSATIHTNIADKTIDEITVKYMGNDMYKPSSHTIKDIVIVGRQSQLTVTQNNNTYNNTNITITVKDTVTDQTIPGIHVTVTYPNGTTQTLTTDENGEININPQLPVGENSITLTVPETPVYNSTSTTITVNVTKRETTTTAALTNNTLHNTIITVEVSDKTTGQKVTSGELEVINMENNETIATATITSEHTNIKADINPGTYNLTIKYKGNNEYLPSENTLDEMTVVKRLAEITVNTINNSVNNIQLSITVTDPVTGTTINNAPIAITLPDETTINTDTGATGTTLQQIRMSSGSQTISIEYLGNNEYNNTITTYTLKIDKLPSKVTLTPVTGISGEPTTLTAQVTDTNNAPVTGGKLVFKLNDVTLKQDNEVIYAQVENGIASITYKIPENMVAKSYKLSATYEGNNEYNANKSSTVLFNIKQRQSKLTITTQETLSIDDNLQIHVTITDKHDSTKEVNGYVIFKIDGKTLTINGETIKVAITNNKADYTYTLSNIYSARKHTITALLSNGSYVRSQASTTFNITRTQTRINLKPIQMGKTSTQLTGTITNTQNKPLMGTNKIAVKINGKTLKGSDGQNLIYQVQDGNINITLPIKADDYAQDTYTIEVVTGPRSTYTGAKNTTTMTKTLTKNTYTNTKTSTTIREYVKINPTNTITTTQNTDKIEISIQDVYNKPIKKGQVTFKQANKTLNTTKITNTRAKLEYKFTKPGTYQITATYTDSTGQYQTTNKTFTITVIDTKTGVQILANNTQTTVGETITYTTLLFDQYTNPVNTGTLSITINNQTTTQKVKNGITTSTITLKHAGKYQITIKYHENQEYKSKTITKTITVNKKTPKITIKTPTITAGKTAQIAATITTNTGVPLNEGKIQWKINGKTLKNTKQQAIQTPITEGTTNITYTIPQTWAAKKINITATYTGTSNFQITHTNKNITIPQLKTKATITLPPKIQTKDTIQIKIRTTDTANNKTPIGTNKIAIKLNHKTIKTPTIQNGTLTLNYKLPLLKTNNTQKITIVHSNKYYTRTETHKQFKIQKINTTIELKDQKIKKNSTLHIQATVKDTHGEVMQRNDTYCVKLNGKTIHTGRLKNGQIDFKLLANYKTGKTYNLTIKTTPNHYYNALAKTVKLTVTN